MQDTINQTVQQYLDSYLSADAEGIARAFHPEVRLYTVEEGRLERTDLADWLEGLRERKRKGDVRVAETRILSVDRAGAAASVKATIRLPRLTFTDYLSLLEIEGRWTIVGKIYQAESAPAPQQSGVAQ